MRFVVSKKFYIGNIATSLLSLLHSLNHNVFIVTIFLIIIQFKKLDGGFICRSDPCINGICIDYLEKPLEYECFCINGFTGYSCQINWDECKSSPCMNGGICFDGIASFNCTCPSNFTGSLCQFDLSTTCGQHLQCQNNGTCQYYNANNTTANSEDALVGNCLCLPGFTGYHCEIETVNCSSQPNICLNGDCIFDSMTLTERCQCVPGFTGKFCQIDIDECAIRPCHHDGVCLDKINGFDCACPFGYTGRLCENKLKICEENPCENGGFCLEEEENKKTCYCVPDFHGELCQYQYNECEPEPQCHNGGTCIDGVGEFKCSCPPTFYGPLCQCTTTNTSHNTSEECQEFLDNTTLSTGWLPPTSTPTTIILFPSEDLMTTIIRTTGIIWATEPLSTILIETTQEYETLIYPASTTPYLEYSITSLILPTDYYHSETLIMSSPILQVVTSFVAGAESAEIISTPTYGLSSTLVESISIITELITIYPSAILPSGEIDSSITKPPAYNGTITTTIQTAIITTPHPSSDVPVLFSTEVLEDSSIKSTTLLEMTNSSGRFEEEMNQTSTIMYTSISTIELTQTASMNESPALQTPVITTETITLPEESSSSEVSIIYLASSLIEPMGSKLMSDDVVSTQIITSTFSIVEETQIIVIPSLLISSETILAPSETLYSSFTSLTTTSRVESTHSVTIESDTVFWGPSTPQPTPTLEISEVFETSLVTIEVVPVPASSYAVQEPTEIGPGSISTASTVLQSITSTQIIIPTHSLSHPVDSSATMAFPPSTTEQPPSSPSPTTFEISSSTTPTSTISVIDACENYCQNSAKCTYSIEAQKPICFCLFKYTGEQCQDLKEKIHTPSFVGNSFLVYNISSEAEPNTMIDTLLNLATLVHNGLILYTGVAQGLTYVLIFIQHGHICLHFSCGEQSMSFIETRTRVDTGFNFTLSFKMEVLLSDFNEIHCLARLSVNESYTMGGEQIVGKESFQFQRHFEELFVGGVDLEMKETLEKHDEMIESLTGLRGCLFKLSLNKIEQDMYDAATNGQNIGECSNFVCTVNPCFGSSICIPSYQFPLWECKCPLEFEGIRCQIPICSNNHCLNGGSCIVTSDPNNTKENSMHNELNSSTGVQQITACNCKLGYTGEKCETITNITQPSFHPLPNYSSYISYIPLTNMKDWFQLKFHFITQNMAQFGLLLFIGGRNPNFYHYGHSSSIGEGQGKEPPQIESPIISYENTTNTDMLNEIGLGEEHEEEPEESLDFFAISFLQGYLALTWNLGSGVQRIISPYRIDTRLSVHTLYTGKDGKTSWLKVDGMSNTSGTSPGKYKRLDTGMSELFIGGYETFRMEGLPYDLSLHEGFQGCVFDLGFRVKNKLFLPKVSSGRNVGNCFVDYYTQHGK